MYLPDFDFVFTQYQDNIIPQTKGLITTAHPGWDYFLGAGKIKGNSVKLPFALIEKGANCTHNGVINFNLEDDKLTNLRYSINQETCLYHKFNLSGIAADAKYIPSDLDLTPTVESFKRQQAKRLNTQSFETISVDYPSLNMANLTRHIVNNPNITSYGIYVDGVSYIGKCKTRSGEYQFCENMLFPSYSTSKSAYGALALLHLAQEYGESILEEKATYYVLEMSESANFWDDITLEHLLDMTTGHYFDKTSGKDEDGDHILDFFLKYSRADKMQVALNFPFQTDPGNTFVYQTSNTYVLSHALESFLQKQQGPDIDLFNYLKKTVYGPIGIDVDSFSFLRNWTAKQQNIGTAWGGYGMWWTHDSIVKLAKLFLEQNGKQGDVRLLHEGLLKKSLGLIPDKRFPTGKSNYLYNNGFWQKDFSKRDGFNCDFTVAFMSGYGGIVVALFPNNVIYYHFSDGGIKRDWWSIVYEVDKIQPFCKV